MGRMDDATRRERRQMARGQERKGKRLDLGGESARAAARYEAAADQLDGTGDNVAIALLRMRAAVNWALAGETDHALALYRTVSGRNGIDAASVATVGVFLRQELAAALATEAPFAAGRVHNDAQSAERDLRRGPRRHDDALPEAQGRRAERESGRGRLERSIGAAWAARGRSPRGRVRNNRAF
ncbi:MAG: hypothetical protein ACOYNI_12440 [Acidimicrobiia bacterium]